MENLGIIQFLVHFMNLDIGWLLYLLLNSLPFLFAYICVLFIFSGGNLKTTLYGTLVLSLNMWALVDFVGILGLTVFVGNLLMLFYMGKFTVLTFAEQSPRLKKNLFLFNEIQGWGTIVLFNLGLFAILGVGM